MQSIKIREANIDDIDSICLILGQGVQYHENILPDYFQNIDHSQTLEDLGSDIKKDSSDYFLALKDNLVVGVLNLKEIQQPQSPIFIPHAYALIKRLVVHEEFRNMHIGTILLDRAKQWAREKSLSGIRLHVWTENQAAINFYSKNEFGTLTQMMNFDL